MYMLFSVTMVLNQNGIEPTFLKLDSGSPGAGFIPIITSNILDYIKEKKNSRKKKNSFMRTKKHLTQFLKMGSISFWVQFHAYQLKHIKIKICTRLRFCPRLVSWFKGLGTPGSRKLGLILPVWNSVLGWWVDSKD